MDVEDAFLGFSNACASAGRVGCKLLTLTHDGATGKEVKRFIEDSHDVSNHPNTLSGVFAQCNTRLVLKVLLTKPDKAIVNPGQIKSEPTFIAFSNYTRVFTGIVCRLDDVYLIRARNSG